jgi:ubiquinone/menaquinone biosynthesis C-methylase UbiE
VVAIDGAASMLELAKSRLRELSQRVEWVLSDFRTMPATVIRPDTFDVVISSYALHHLNAQEKLAVLKLVVRAIKPGGWFLNADLVMAEAPNVERRIQEIRVKAITDLAPAQDKRFYSTDATRQFLDDLEATEQDQPQTLNQDMRILRESGITNAEVFWKEYREVVIGGSKERYE